MMKCRTLAAIAFLATIVSSPCDAQDGRFSVEVSTGRATDGPIFEHTVPADPAFASTTVTRLAVDDGSVVAGRVGYRIGGDWMLVGEAALGSSHYYYSQFMTALGGLRASSEQWGTASRTSFGVGLAYRSSLAAVPLTIEPEVNVGMQRLQVGQRPVDCVPTAPSLGSPGTCPQTARWERTYSVPSVGVGLSVGYVIVPHATLLLRGRYAVGRTSTREGFYDDLLPQYDYAEAPTSQAIRSSQLSLGMRIAP